MKYTLICAVVTGLLAVGLPAEATVVTDGIAKSVKTIQRTELYKKAGRTMAGNTIGAGQTAAGNIVGAGQTAAGNSEEAGNSDGQAEVPAEGVSVLSGGIWADLQPSGSATANFAGSNGTSAGTGGEGGTGNEIPADTGNGMADAGREPAGDTEPENEYADLAIADVSNYVNVRSGPDTGSAVVGKIYAGAVAQILETVDGEDGEWFRVVSGNVEGYMKSEFFLYGDAAAEVIDNYVTRYAVVLATRLNVREEPGTENRRIGYIDQGRRRRSWRTWATGLRCSIRRAGQDMWPRNM